MTKRSFTPVHPTELRERGVRLFQENRGDYASDAAAYRAIAPKLGCSPDACACGAIDADGGHVMPVGAAA